MLKVGKVGTEFRVNTQVANGSTGASYPDITRLANGGFVVTWLDYSRTLGDSDGSSVKAQVFGASGTQLGSEFLVNTQTAGFQGPATITSLSNGGFVVTWSDSSGTLGDSSEASVKAQVFGANGSKLGPEFLVNTQTVGVQRWPVITGLANGGFVVTWEDDDYGGKIFDPDGKSIRAQVFTAAGAKVGPELRVNTQTVNFQEDPAVTGLTTGDFVVTWVDGSRTLGDNDGSSIKAQLFTSGGAKVGTEFLVNTVVAGGQAYPTIASLTNGGFVVTWEDSSGTLGDSEVSSIKAQVFTAEGIKAGPEFLVNTQTANGQRAPTITSLANGGFVITWTDGSGTLGDSDVNSIKAQVFSANGTKVDTEFLVNTYTKESQFNSTVTGLANGDFVVTWNDYSGSLAGGTPGTKAQIFTLINPPGSPVVTSDGGGATAALLIKENTTAVTTVQATDPDAGTTLTYKIISGTDAGRFIINAATGALSFLGAPNFDLPTDRDVNNVYEVTVSASDGTLTDIQAISVTVTDVTSVARSVRNDFNGDGRSDVLWRNSNGQLSNWLGSANGRLADNGFVVNQFVPNAWKIIGTGDFNGDGRSDVLWRNDSGKLSNWLSTANGGLLDNGGVVNQLVPIEWKTFGFGDFNGDGRSDVLWRNVITGQLSNWLGTTNGGLVDNGHILNQFVPIAWKIAGTGDFNGDGFSDVLWRNDNGQLSQWLGYGAGGLLDNGAVVNQVVPNAWKIAGTGDFNGDGFTDVLWRNDNGRLSEWLGSASGRLIDNGAVVNQLVSNIWKIAGTGDFNGDGRSDVLWRNSNNGQLSEWLGTANGNFVDNGGVVNQIVSGAWQTYIQDYQLV